MLQRRAESSAIWISRGVVLAGIIIGLINYQSLQNCVNIIWDYLFSSWVFNSAYFETGYVTIIYQILLLYPYLINFIPYFDKYKIDKKIKWEHTTIVSLVKEVFIYVIPLLILDAIKTKRYPGVDPTKYDSDWWIITVRHLPEAAPTIPQIIFEVTMSIIAFDAVFFLFHFIIHYNKWLYQNIHKPHHEHGQLQSRITNKLTVIERLYLLGIANYSLKLFGSHPLSRIIFVLIFTWLLIENHCGYDMPWGYDKYLPSGVAGGAYGHYQHHALGVKLYQPFLTYLDNLYEKYGDGNYYYFV